MANVELVTTTDYIIAALKVRIERASDALTAFRFSFSTRFLVCGRCEQTVAAGGRGCINVTKEL